MRNDSPPLTRALSVAAPSGSARQAAATYWKIATSLATQGGAAASVEVIAHALRIDPRSGTVERMRSWAAVAGEGAADLLRIGSSVQGTDANGAELAMLEAGVAAFPADCELLLALAHAHAVQRERCSALLALERYIRVRSGVGDDDARSDIDATLAFALTWWPTNADWRVAVNELGIVGPFAWSVAAPAALAS